MPGTASRKENLAAPERDRPSARPAVMVTPEREVPGISARACAHADGDRLRPAEAVLVTVAPAEAVRGVHQETEQRQRARDEERLAKMMLDVVAEAEPDQSDRHRADEDLPREPAVAIVPSGEASAARRRPWR